MQVGTNVNIVDKSGAYSGLVIRVLRNLNVAKVGSLIVVVVKGALPKKKKKKKFARKGEVFRAVVLSNRLPIRRSTQYYLRFLLNNVILLKKNEFAPFSNRMTASVPREVRQSGLVKILSMAYNVY